MRRLPEHLRALFILCLFVAALDSAAARNEGEGIVARATLSVGASTTAEQTTNAATTTSAQPTTQTQPTTTTTTPQPQTTPTTSSSSNSPAQPTTTAAPQTTTAPAQTTNGATETNQRPSNAPASSIIVSTGTDANGQPIVTTVFVSSPTSSSSSSSSAAPSHSNPPAGDTGGGGVGVSTIIGLSVAGGIAAIGIVAFFIWKLTRKRYGDFDDEPIKWPDLNDHTEEYAPPRKELSTSAGTMDSTLEVNRNTTGYYSQTVGTESAADLYAPGNDPYAVPPLPHMNPNQPYRDDPGNPSFYDPYRGPVPQTFDNASVQSHDPLYGGGGEAIPMNNLAGTGGPQHDVLERPGTPQASITGRQSPSPGVPYNPPNAYGGRASPLPSPFGGAMSPPPGPYGGRASPSPGMIAGGRQSPGPGPAYRAGF